MFKHILVPTDGSSLSLGCVARAASFAKESGAQLTLLYVQPESPFAYAGLGAISSANLTQEIQTRMDEATQDILNAAEQRVQEAGSTCQRVVMIGDKPHALIIAAAEANNCDLVFMASHGRTGIGAVVLGSETQKVLAHTRIPVLVYR